MIDRSSHIRKGDRVRNPRTGAEYVVTREPSDWYVAAITTDGDEREVRFRGAAIAALVVVDRPAH